MEIARAFSALPGPPKRSVLFLLATGEEAGLLGSDYFATQPTVPKEQIVADINIDGGINLFPTKDVIAYGEEHSSLKPHIRRVAADVGLEVSLDPFPEEGFFVRTDLYSFVRKGIPGVYLDVGLQSLDPKIDGSAIFRKWMVTTYHSPKDDMSQPFNFESSVRLGRLAFFLGRTVAMQDERPQWNQGDFFGRKFGNHKP
jgi:Zn-dependent M28 family amino/carboxypeptidase